MHHRTAAVVLAAGAGTRFAGPLNKLRTEVEGTPMVRRCVDIAVGSGIGPVFVVTGSEPLDDVLPLGVTTVRAADWSSGRSASLTAAVKVLADTTFAAMVVGLGDMPWVTAEGWRVIAAGTAPITVATYGGHPRLPIRIDRSLWAELPVTGDDDTSMQAHVRPDAIEHVEVPGDGRDVDTLDDLANR